MNLFEDSSKSQDRVEKEQFKSTDVKTHRDKFFAKQNMISLLTGKKKNGISLTDEEKLELIKRNSKKNKKILSRLFSHGDDIYGKIKREVENIYNRNKF